MIYDHVSFSISNLMAPLCYVISNSTDCFGTVDSDINMNESCAFIGIDIDISTSTEVGDLKAMLQDIIFKVTNSDIYKSQLLKDEGICDTVTPTVTPSMRPSTSPSRVRTLSPSATPSLRPTMLPTSSPSNAPSTIYKYEYDFSFDAEYSIQCFAEFVDYKVVTELSNEISDYHDTSINVAYVHHGK